MSNWGFVYCLSNESMPGLYKIGYTTRSPMQRAEELSRSTGVPTHFDVWFYLETQNPAQVEKRIHDEMARYRTNECREFFSVDDREIFALFELIDDCQGCIAQSYDYQTMCAIREYELSNPNKKGKGMAEFYAEA